MKTSKCPNGHAVKNLRAGALQDCPECGPFHLNPDGSVAPAPEVAPVPRKRTPDEIKARQDAEEAELEEAAIENADEKRRS